MVIQSQGDLESRYEIILKPIRDLTKNWDVDLASQLEQYLEEVSDFSKKKKNPLVKYALSNKFRQIAVCLTVNASRIICSMCLFCSI